MTKATTNSPMGYHNPCLGENGEEPKYFLSGRSPDLSGGGVLFWAYSEREGIEAFAAYAEFGYSKLELERR